ncbi:hypothetical protein [Crenobacter intestini]|uniref:hypothetical protein n=1 Tax=Crenobacter intestini TaxID=2563443 RepID=UPI0014589EE6|nr:hypothetical protein [Crenobacter intestini]
MPFDIDGCQCLHGHLQGGRITCTQLSYEFANQFVRSDVQLSQARGQLSFFWLSFRVLQLGGQLLLKPVINVLQALDLVLDLPERGPRLRRQQRAQRDALLKLVDLHLAGQHQIWLIEFSNIKQLGADNIQRTVGTETCAKQQRDDQCKAAIQAMREFEAAHHVCRSFECECVPS